MASLSLTSPPEGQAETFGSDNEPSAAGCGTGAWVIVGLGNNVATAYAEHAKAHGHRVIPVLDSGRFAVEPASEFHTESFRQSLNEADTTLCIFLGHQLTPHQQWVIDDLLEDFEEYPPRAVCVVSSLRVHLGDPAAAQDEAWVLSRLRPLGRPILQFRTGHLLGQRTRMSTTLRRFGACFPLIPARLRGCCLESADLFNAMDAELAGLERRTGGSCGAAVPAAFAGETPAPQKQYRRRRTSLTLPGSNLSWRSRFEQARSTTRLAKLTTATCWVFSWTFIPELLGLIFAFFAARRPALRQWHTETLRPKTFRELRMLYNPYSFRHLKVVGYNNGVHHFGHKHPGKTVISTILLDRVVRHGDHSIRVDSGTTVRKALDFLAMTNQDLFVIPNYSYVCLGTAFFVPIHGSAADYSCVADTIDKAVLYDPISDRLIVATRDEDDFRDHVYEPDSAVLLLRLYLRVKPKSRYYMHEQTREKPTAAELLAELRDGRAANVEVRKKQASETSVRVLKFYNESAATSEPVLELPRDKLGRLWDKLEENPFTAFAMHAAGRHLLWHIEMFLSDEEFTKFWETHGQTPLKKMQFRHIRKDGLPKSPFKDADCVSVDTFAMRKHRKALEAYLAKTFGNVRLNPGKHSK